MRDVNTTLHEDERGSLRTELAAIFSVERTFLYYLVCSQKCLAVEKLALRIIQERGSGSGERNKRTEPSSQQMENINFV